MDEREEDEANRQRVREKIGAAIMLFYDTVGETEWIAEKLRTFVRDRVPNIAPASPDRILRLLRQEGKFDYVIVNRRQSLYRFVLPPAADESGQFNMRLG